jgi:phosphoribosyl-dephospho-CoA transferase
MQQRNVQPHNYQLNSYQPNSYQPHDLLWVRAINSQADLPAWFSQSDLSQRPVVVRRAPRQVDRIAIGIRGTHRSQRHADYVAPEAVIRSVTPEKLVDAKGWLRQNHMHPLPHWYTLAAIDHLMQIHHLHWGITGSLAFELATGIPTANAQSDIDLRLNCPKAIDKNLCRFLDQQLQTLPQRSDVQIETPDGAFAMREWLNNTGDILLKSNQGPILTPTPWQIHSI